MQQFHKTPFQRSIGLQRLAASGPSRWRWVGIFLWILLTGLPSLAEKLPIEEDPNDPAIINDMAERRRRQRILIQKKLQQRQRMIEERQRQEGAGQAAVTPTPPPQAPAHAEKTTETLKQSKLKQPVTTDAQMAGQPYLTLYLSPASVTVKTGESFATVVAIRNSHKLFYDSIEILLHYPPENLRPRAIHQYDLLSLLEGAPECEVDEQAGTIRYKAPFKEAINGLEKSLITVQWQALAPAQAVQIQPYIGKRHSAVYLGGKLQSETVFGVEDALAGASVRIEDKRPAVPRGEQFLTKTKEELDPILAGIPNRAEKPPTLWIDQPSSGILKAGQWVVIDVGIENPDGAIFDEVRLAGRFDPASVELVDSDRGNWIHSGRNVLDGPFHDLWPWTLFYENRIVPRDGYYYYRMGTNKLGPQPQGPMIRIFAQMKRDAPGPILDWLWGDARQPDSPTTGLYLTGRDLYFETVRFRDRSFSEQLYGVRVPDIDMIEKADPADYRF